MAITTTGTRDPRPLARLVSQPATVQVPDRGTVTLRATVPDDIDDVTAMHVRRCSTGTTYGPLPGCRPVPPPGDARRPAGDPGRRRGFAPRGTVVAVGNVAPSERPDVTELALLVEDDWQGPGLGTAMARHLPRAG